jgi:BirA family transcriptional regulator, biotin operon repressor / biotin---[acetyl-CoA-carboxylase] ligase
MTRPLQLAEHDCALLAHMLQHPGTFVSGQQLADHLGVSRVAVWSRIQRLMRAGFGFRARRNCGYQLTHEPLRISEPLLRAWWLHRAIDAPLHFHSETDSTNSRASALLASGSSDPLVVVAARQTAGRGRFGRVWHSPPDGNLYASLAFRPNREPAMLQTVTLWLGLALCHRLNSRWNLPVRIKWPNDLWLGDRKVCGMLCEARVDADATRELVFGFGLNINSDPLAWPADLQSSAAALATAHRACLPWHELSSDLILHLLTAWHQFMAGNCTEPLLELWGHYDLLAGRPIWATLNNQPLTGVADGVEPNGHLRLQLADGSLRLLAAGEVSLHDNRPPAL